MISERNGNVKVQDNLHGEKIAMDIAAGAKAHIMAILTNLYGNRKMAVLREYSTNAYDSHIMAGTPDRPIEVTTPQPNAPLGSRTLKIRDYGIGLSIDDIHAIYSQYGESTKNNSNDYNGMLGLGSKSGLTYTNSFSVTATKDGVRVAVAVGLDDEGLPQMTVMETVHTSDPNGVLVAIPCKGGDDFHTETHQLYKYWRKGTVRVNGKEPEDFRDSALKVCEEDGITIWIDEARGRDENVILMGNVPYPVDIDHKMQTGSIIAEVPIGAVNFTPAREGLMDTARTRATVVKVEALFFKHIKAAAQRDIDAAPSSAAALDRMHRWEATMARGAKGGDYTYKGKPIPRNFSHSRVPTNEKDLRGNTITLAGMVKVPYSKHKLAQHWRIDSIGSEAFKHAIWFTGFDLANFNANHRKKIDHWLGQQDPKWVQQFVGGSYYRSDAVFLLVNDTPPTEWVGPSRIVPWSTIAAIRLNTSTSASVISGKQRLTGSYDLIEDGTCKTQVLANDIKTDKPLLCMKGNLGQARYYIEALNHFYPNGYTLVYMGENRLGKFQRDFPQALKAVTTVESKIKQWVDNLPSDHKIGLAMKDQYILKDYQKIDPAKVQDPQLKNLVRISNMDLTGAAAMRVLAYKIIGRYVLRDHFSWADPMDKKYPLFSAGVLVSNPDHVYHYLNTAYAATI